MTTPSLIALATKRKASCKRTLEKTERPLLPLGKVLEEKRTKIEKIGIEWQCIPMGQGRIIESIMQRAKQMHDSPVPGAPGVLPVCACRNRDRDRHRVLHHRAQRLHQDVLGDGG